MATTLRRALNDRLEREGWEDIGRLTIRRNSSSFIQVGKPTTPVPDALSGHAEKVGRTLVAKAKPMSLNLARFFPEERRAQRGPMPIPKVKEKCTVPLWERQEVQEVL